MNIDQLYASGVIEDIDRAFAQMLDRRLGGIDPWVALAAALVSRAAAAGHVCLDLAVLTREGLKIDDSPVGVSVEFPLEPWIDKLRICPAVGALHENKPMILDRYRLYLHRYWRYENLVARGILDRCGPIDDASGMWMASDASLAELFSRTDVDQQKAIRAALARRFAVISGGPGTGKTFTIAQIILSLHRLNASQHLRIKLAGPTGKAAARLQEALDQAFRVLQKNGHKIPEDALHAQTIHRLLGATPGRTQFLFNAKNQLPADVVIVDEASMIDLSLMAKLIQAVPASARLVLVGDKDQLASVEAGAVLGDICGGLTARESVELESGPGEEPASGSRYRGTGFSNHIVVLKKNYRFDADSGIDALAAAVNAGDADRSLALLESELKGSIAMRHYHSRKEMGVALERLVIEKIAPAFKVGDPLKALQQINTLKILTPLRKGPVGVLALNQWVEQILVRHDVIEPLQASMPAWYSGRPVMITSNDYYHNLFNGDVGIAMAAPAARSPMLQVFFPDQKQGIKSLVPEQLPGHETVYAMTVHKGQGTEFDCVVLILPDVDVPILTRELLYTAITRARRQVEIWGHAGVLKKAIGRRIRRASGLRESLWPNSKL